MRTTFSIDDKRAQKLMSETRAHTLVEALKAVVGEYLRLREKNKLLSLFGKTPLNVDIDELRAREK